MSIADTSASAIRGWECTPTGEPPCVITTSENEYNSKCAPAPFIKGWRRNALYGILVFLIFLVLLNVALTLWIISALKLSMVSIIGCYWVLLFNIFAPAKYFLFQNGVGPIKIVKGGIHLQGQAWIKDNLVTSMITSQIAQPITLNSHRNFTILVADANHAGHSRLFISK